MNSPSFVRAFVFMLFVLSVVAKAKAQGARKAATQSHGVDADADHIEERARWFSRGRLVRGKSAAELRRRAFASKMQARVARAAMARPSLSESPPVSFSGGWTPLGPVPLASDGTGQGLQDYHQVSGRATAVAIDPADASGNTVYIGGAQGGVWKSTNAASSVANNVSWTPVTDDQATLSIGALVIQPGNSDPTKSVVLAGTGESSGQQW